MLEILDFTIELLYNMNMSFENKKPWNFKWNEEAVFQDAQKYKKKYEWKKNSPCAYSAARRNGWLDRCCAHMPKHASYGSAPHNKKWYKENVLEDAKKYSYVTEWAKASAGALDAAKDRGWYDEATAHMVNRQVQVVWTPESILKDLRKGETTVEWRARNPSAYNAARKLGILENITGSPLRDQVEPWTAESVMNNVGYYEQVTTWIKENPSAYHYARKHGLLSEIYGRLKRIGGTSTSEQHILSYVKSKYPKAHSTRFANKNPRYPATRYELDIYIPELRKGIEFDGTFHHSEEGLKRGRPSWTDEQIKDYHKDKDAFFEERDIKVIHIKEEEWTTNKDECLAVIERFIAGE